MLGVQSTVIEDPLTRPQTFTYHLFIISTVLIAGAGNAINDYFDLRADRLNRPKSMVIGKRLKRRWAIIVHWGFNALGLVISIRLCVQLHTWFFLFIHLFSATVLWVYSIYIKKVVFWSNAIISMLIAIVPLSSMIFFMILEVKMRYIELIVSISITAFIVNLAREILKDIQDIEGDRLILVRSLPMVLGEKTTRYITAFLCFGVWVPFGLAMYLKIFPMYSLFCTVYAFSSVFCSSVGLLSLMKVSSGNLALLLKISMLFAVISMFLL